MPLPRILLAAGLSQRSQLFLRVSRRPGSINLVRAYTPFDQLTSISVNCTNTQLCVSGYSNSVWLYDVQTGAKQEFPGIHDQHINITRFSNHSPYMFATSSFDRKVKMWDSRTKCTTPTYERMCVASVGSTPHVQLTAPCTLHPAHVTPGRVDHTASSTD